MDLQHLNVPIGLLWAAMAAVCTAAAVVVKAGLTVMKAARSWFQQSDRLNHAADVVLGPGQGVPPAGSPPHPNSLLAYRVTSEGQIDLLRKRVKAAELFDHRPDITDTEAVARYFAEHLDTGQFQAIVASRHTPPPQPPQPQPQPHHQSEHDPAHPVRVDTRWRGEPK